MLGHEPLVAPHIDIEEIDVELCLLFDCLGNIPAGSNRVAREIAEDGVDGALLRTVPFFERLDHLVICVRVMEVNKEGRIVVMMDFR